MSESRAFEKRYTVKQTLTGKLVVMVSQYVPGDLPGDWYWNRYKKAGLDDVRAIVALLMHKGGTQ